MIGTTLRLRNYLNLMSRDGTVHLDIDVGVTPAAQVVGVLIRLENRAGRLGDVGLPIFRPPGQVCEYRGQLASDVKLFRLANLQNGLRVRLFDSLTQVATNPKW